MQLVDPLQKPPQAPPPQPCAKAKNVIRRNLFDSHISHGEIDELLLQENKRKLDYVESRYNIRLKVEECNEQKISIKTKQFEIDCLGEKTKSHFLIDASLKKDRKLVAILPYARPQGIKRTFPVRKAHNGNSKVPIRQIVPANNKSNKKNNNCNNNINRNENNNNKSSEIHTKADDDSKSIENGAKKD